MLVNGVPYRKIEMRAVKTNPETEEPADGQACRKWDKPKPWVIETEDKKIITHWARTEKPPKIVSPFFVCECEAVEQSLPQYPLYYDGGLGGPVGFGSSFIPRGDDNGEFLPPPWPFKWFTSEDVEETYISQNGLISIDIMNRRYTPLELTGVNYGILPYWCDIDTTITPENANENLVYYATPNEAQLVVTWCECGYYYIHLDKRCTFQAVITRIDSDNLIISFFYKKLEWTTGDASNGTNGFARPGEEDGFGAGYPARAGIDGRNGISIELPGSGTEDVMNLVNGSNLPAPVPGVWAFRVQNGQISTL